MIRVRATKRGFGGAPCHLIEPGVEFSIPNEQAFSAKWMEKLEAPKPAPEAKAEAKKAEDKK